MNGLNRDFAFSLKVAAPAHYTVNSTTAGGSISTVPAIITYLKNHKRRQSAENPTFWHFFGARRPAISPQRYRSSLCHRSSCAAKFYGISPKLAVLVIGANNSNGNDNTAEEIADGKMIHYLDINDKFLTKDGFLSAKVMPDYLHPD